jgi:hypothetical protein
MATDDPRSRWAASGAMALTGDPGGPALVAPPGIVRRIEALGARAGVDGLAVLGERAAIAGLSRAGAVSAGGATRLLPAGDGGWVAVALVRPDDVDLVPAWLGLAGPPDDAWASVAAGVVAAPATAVAAAGRELGLPVAAVGEVPPGGPGGGPGPGPGPVVARRLGDAPPGDPAARPPLVVDLSSLWAGPLCSRLLQAHGARVVKVESTRRPDGARRGPAAFFALLHAGQEAVALDLGSPKGVARLRGLVAAADVVIEGSRPRALAQLGVDAEAMVAAGAGPRVWVSITGYGRDGDAGGQVAFGDDAAAAGGLLAWGADGRPRFVADAVADPLTGMAAAGAVLDALAGGGRWLLDVALARAAAAVAGPEQAEQWAEGAPGEARPSRPPPAPAGRPPEVGEHTASVLAELDLV